MTIPSITRQEVLIWKGKRCINHLLSWRGADHTCVKNAGQTLKCWFAVEYNMLAMDTRNQTCTIDLSITYCMLPPEALRKAVADAHRRRTDLLASDSRADDVTNNMKNGMLFQSCTLYAIDLWYKLVRNQLWLIRSFILSNSFNILLFNCSCTWVEIYNSTSWNVRYPSATMHVLVHQAFRYCT